MLIAGSGQFLLIIFGSLNLVLCDPGHGVCSFIDTNTSLDKEGMISIGSKLGYVESAASGEVLSDNKTMRCASRDYGCFSFWLKNNDTGHITILKQGCWMQPEACVTDRCIASVNMKKHLEDTRFCCCKGDYCNDNLTDNLIYMVLRTTDGPIIKAGPFPDRFYREKIIAKTMIPIVVGAFIILLVFTVFRILWSRSFKESTDSVHLMESSTCHGLELDSLKLNTLVNGGRYGEVWSGTLNDMDVAVKVFTGNSQRQYYLNEKDIYSLPHMEHESLPHFFGAEERVTVDGMSQYLLVMEYISIGTLTDFLKHNTLDWTLMCKLCHTTASGLAYLHTDIHKSGKVKPVIAHRDLNTRNILVRPNNICVLCDFGFAMQLSGSNYTQSGIQEIAEQSSLSDVGTIRYMSPEVLEGAVNLRDCEASLRQIDVYALGLVFWEIGTQCSDLYQGLPVPEYQLPFHAELGPHPSFDEMQLLVSKNKVRPSFPDIWKDSNQAIRALKETIEDCWDQDGEARLTAMCVEERVLEMESLWSARYKVALSPTVNATNLKTNCKPVMEKKLELCNTTSTYNDQTDSTANKMVKEHNARNMETSYNRDSLTMLSVQSQSNSCASEHSMSTATTDTLLSPLDTVRPPPNVTHARRWNIYISRPKVLEPHQGMNPIVERNTHKSSDEDLEIQGNALIKSGNKSVDVSLNSKSSDYPLLPQNSHLFRQETTTSVQRQPNRNAPRIPFRQNDVASEPLIVKPKQPNLPQKENEQPWSKSLFGKIFKISRLNSLSLSNKELVKKEDKNKYNTKYTGASKKPTCSVNNNTSNLPILQNGENIIGHVGKQRCLQSDQTVFQHSVPTDNHIISVVQRNDYLDNSIDVTNPTKTTTEVTECIQFDKVVNCDSKNNLYRPEARNDSYKGQKSLNLGSLKSQSHRDLSTTITSNKAKRPCSLLIKTSNSRTSLSVIKNQGHRTKGINESCKGQTINVTHYISSPELSTEKKGDIGELLNPN